jgi:hypothetical protein
MKIHSLVRLASFVSLICRIEATKDHLSTSHPDRRNLEDCALDEASIGRISVEIENNSSKPFTGSLWLDDLDPNTEDLIWEAQFVDTYQVETYPFEYMQFKNTCLDKSRCYRIKIENPRSNEDDALYSIWTEIKYNGEVIMNGPIGQLLYSPLFGEGCDCQIPKHLRIETSEQSDNISWELKESDKILWKADDMNLSSQTNFNFTYLICYERCYHYDWNKFHLELYLDEAPVGESLSNESIDNYLLGNACASAPPSRSQSPSLSPSKSPSPSTSQLPSMRPSTCYDKKVKGQEWYDSDGEEVRHCNVSLEKI